MPGSTVMMELVLRVSGYFVLKDGVSWMSRPMPWPPEWV